MRAAFLALPPITRLTLIALAVRLVAAVCSQGYFAHDDHFLVVEAAQSWVAGHDYNDWLPWNQGADARPSGHSYFYVGLHFLLFSVLKWFGIGDPKAIMFIVRVLHALWSLAVVRTGYRIALRLANEGTAYNTGLLLALLWFMPFTAVRQLVEVACIPFLLWGCERMLAPSTRGLLLAGVFLGMAINVRFQTVFFAAGPGVVLLVHRRWKDALVYGAGAALPLALVQGGIDLFLWGRPFAEIGEYVRYNLANPTNTGIHLPWYNYLLILAAVFVPPLSVAVFFGFWSAWKRAVLPWSAAIAFLAAHTWFANKQERFILPMLPVFLVLGFAAWNEWRMHSAFWTAREHWWRNSMRFTWALNIVLLLPLLVSYSKRSRCEALYALRNEPWARGLIVEDSHGHEPPQVPLFYWGKWRVPIDYVASDTADVLRMATRHSPGTWPNVVLFIGEEDLEQRIARLEAQLGPLQHITTAEAGLLDRFVHWLNPVNRNESIAVYRVTRGLRAP